MRHRSTWLAALLLATIVPGIPADEIAKWRTPDGGLYFGHEPPAGSRRYGEGARVEADRRASIVDDPEPEPTPEAALPAGEEELRRLSTEASLERRALERRLARLAERVTEIRDRRREVESLRLSGSRWRLATESDAAEAANLTGDRLAELERLRAEERSALGEIASLRREAGALEETVRRAHGGRTPDWWRPVQCPACPRREETADRRP